MEVNFLKLRFSLSSYVHQTIIKTSGNTGNNYIQPWAKGQYKDLQKKKQEVNQDTVVKVWKVNKM